ncbi:transporter substrate-binding domain-containing protein [Desulfonauticus submarinus]
MKKTYFIFCLFFFVFFYRPGLGIEVKDIIQRGELRHLAVPYANFNLGDNTGFCVDLIRAFAKDLGVKYKYVSSSWETILDDLVGRKILFANKQVIIGDVIKIRGDIIASGFTMLDWRKDVVLFSEPTFSTQVWLVSKFDSDLKPIKPSGNEEYDIQRTLNLVKGRRVLGKRGTCLDPSLYKLSQKGAICEDFSGNVNDIAGAVLKGDVELAILDVPDALVALRKWPGQLKVLGPISKCQYMGCAFNKHSIELRNRFNSFLHRIKERGLYLELVKKYFPDAIYYFADFFKF